MRVTKNDKGEFVIDDEPMRLDGEGAAAFIAEMKSRDESGNDAARKKFLSECVAIYRKSQR